MAEKVIEIDAEELFKIVDELQHFPQEIRPAIAHAVNKTLDSAVTKMKREVAAEYTIKQKDVAKTITKGRATVSNLSAAATSWGTQNPLYYFKHLPRGEKRTRYGVKAQVKKDGGYKVIKPNKGNNNKAFKLMRNGSSMIFARTGAKRLPIKKLYTLSVPQMISDMNATKGVIVRVQKYASEQLVKKVEQEINYRLNKMAKKTMEGKGK